MADEIAKSEAMPDATQASLPVDKAPPVGTLTAAQQPPSIDTPQKDVIMPDAPIEQAAVSLPDFQDVRFTHTDTECSMQLTWWPAVTGSRQLGSESSPRANGHTSTRLSSTVCSPRPWIHNAVRGTCTR
jgi:hypothetical protein